MKKILILICFLFLVNFSLAICYDGCESGTSCMPFGDTKTVNQYTYYCDLNGSLVQQKTSGVCLNDFECASGYSCLDEICTNAYNYFIQGYNMIIANVSGICYGEDYFCSNISVSNATILVNKSCSFYGVGFGCYKCNSNYYYNATLGKCITGICSANPGCMSNSSIVNASIGTDYCADNKKCFACDSDFEWNTTANACKMKQCTSSPGCLNVANLTNGNMVQNRYCSTGSCFACKPCYVWNSNVSSCVYSSSCSSGNINWSSVYFSSSDLASGVYKLLSSHDRVDFTFQGRNYWLGILGVDSSKVVFKIEYTSVSNYNLFANASASFDLSGDGVNDIKVSLAGISNGKANMSIKFLTVSDVGNGNNNGQQGTSESPSGSDLGTSGDDATDLGSVNSIFNNKNVWWLVVIALIILILIIILIVYLIRGNKRNKGNVNNQVYQQRPPVSPGNAPTTYPVGGYRPPQPVPMQQKNIQPNQVRRM
jgi:hypothetical protein